MRLVQIVLCVGPNGCSIAAYTWHRPLFRWVNHLFTLISTVCMILSDSECGLSCRRGLQACVNYNLSIIKVLYAIMRSHRTLGSIAV